MIVTYRPSEKDRASAGYLRRAWELRQDFAVSLARKDLTGAANNLQRSVTWQRRGMALRGVNARV